MADSSGPLAACLLVRAVGASLKLANESVNSLDDSQLFAMRSKLRESLKIVNRKISDNKKTAPGGLAWKIFRREPHSHPLIEHQREVIDLSDWEDGNTDSGGKHG